MTRDENASLRAVPFVTDTHGSSIFRPEGKRWDSMKNFIDLRGIPTHQNI